MATKKNYANLQRICQSPKHARKGVTTLYNKNNILAQITEHLYNQSQHIGIITGFYIPSADNIETDGPPGALAIGRALTGLGKKVTYVTDVQGGEAMKAIVGDAELLVLQNMNDCDLLDKVDTLVSIERLGRAKDGLYYNARGVSVSAHTLDIDQLFIDAKSMDGVFTIGIGDGGNEIGMGNEYDLVVEHITHGDVLATVTTVDVLLACSVSNWGGYAVAYGLALQRLSDVGDEGYEYEHLVPTEKTEYDCLTQLKDVGVIDGLLGTCGYDVDTYPFETQVEIMKLMESEVLDVLGLVDLK